MTASLTGPFGSRIAEYRDGRLTGQDRKAFVVDPEALRSVLAGVWNGGSPAGRRPRRRGHCLLAFDGGDARVVAVLDVASRSLVSMDVSGRRATSSSTTRGRRALAGAHRPAGRTIGEEPRPQARRGRAHRSRRRSAGLMTLAAEAPAKVNRELRVGGSRPDGYHEIRSRIVSIDLADRLSRRRARGARVLVRRPVRPPRPGEPGRACRELLAAPRRIAPRARLRLEKRVPMGGGLGGGSADAAVALRLLARLWGFDDDVREALPELAARLGSDVPFFLTAGRRTWPGGARA